MTNAPRKRAVQPPASDEANRTEMPAQPPQPPDADLQISRLGPDDESEDHEPTQSSGPTSSRANRPPRSTSGSDIYARDTGPPRGAEHFQADEHRLSRDKLTSFVEQYRNREISKTKALTFIAGAVEDSTSLSDSEKDKTIKLYLEELDSICRESSTDFIAQLHSKRSHNDRELDLDQISLAAKSVDGSQRAESEERDESPGKKRKLSTADLGWAEPNEDLPNGPLPLSCQCTLKKLDIYCQDIPRCKYLIRSSRNAPTGIPSSQWERIFRGEVLNLNHFLSSLHRTTVDEEGETHIGNAKISFGVSDAKRRVSTANEWFSAWNLAASALTFAFPHHADELHAYGDYINSEFAAKVSESHPRVILFDISIRNIVQGGQAFLLTDHQHFLALHSSILLPNGVEIASKKGLSRRSTAPHASGSKTDICNRFNSSNGCPSTQSDCRYHHICKLCKKPGHGKEQCPK